MPCNLWPWPMALAHGFEDDMGGGVWGTWAIVVPATALRGAMIYAPVSPCSGCWPGLLVEEPGGIMRHTGGGEIPRRQCPSRRKRPPLP